jgi:hypothetical protein
VIFVVGHRLFSPFLAPLTLRLSRAFEPTPPLAAALRLVFGTDHCIKMQCPLPKTADQHRRWASGGDMMRLLVNLTCAALVLFAQAVWGAEKLVYSVGYKNSGYGYTVVKTEIFSVDPETGERQIIFSDDMTPIAVIQIPFVFHFPVVGGDKLFAHASERDKSRPFPGNGSLYELSIDGQIS